MESPCSSIQEEIPLATCCGRICGLSRNHGSDLFPECVLENQHDRNDGSSVPGVRRRP